MTLEPDSRPSALFFIPTLAAGGAERVCVQYLNDLKTFRPILMLQFRRGELLKELHAATPVLEINAYTGYGERGRVRRRRLHHAIRRRRRRLQVRLKGMTRKLRSLRWAIRRKRRILKVRLRYLERRVRTNMKEKYGKRTVWFLQETERVVNFMFLMHPDDKTPSMAETIHRIRISLPVTDRPRALFLIRSLELGGAEGVCNDSE